MSQFLTFKVPFEVINQIIGRIRDNLSFALDQFGRWAHILGDLHGFSELPVRLAVQLISPDKDGSRLLSGLKEHQVSGHPIILINLDNIANL